MCTKSLKNAITASAIVFSSFGTQASEYIGSIPAYTFVNESIIKATTQIIATDIIDLYTGKDATKADDLNSNQGLIALKSCKAASDIVRQQSELIGIPREEALQTMGVAMAHCMFSAGKAVRQEEVSRFGLAHQSDQLN